MKTIPLPAILEITLGELGVHIVKKRLPKEVLIEEQSESEVTAPEEGSFRDEFGVRDGLIPPTIVTEPGGDDMPPESVSMLDKSNALPNIKKDVDKLEDNPRIE